MKGLLFDLDGVLVDVSRSYHSAIIETVRIFSKKWITGETIYRYKLIPGLNNDWDLCMAILEDYSIVIPKPLVAGKFQELLKGKSWNGYIREDTWLLERPVLNQLHSNYSLAIVTGRNREETDYTLDKSGVTGYFKTVITTDDIEPGRDKPHPDSILKAIKILGTDRNIDLGDTINDVMAARRAGIDSISVIGTKHSRDYQDSLLNAGTGAVLSDINNIMEVLNERK